jgi:hypothetical protein
VIRRIDRADRLALLAALLFFIALALFGARWHWVEEAGTAERDGYVAQAKQILGGTLPRDPFRPLLYPLLTAGLALLSGDAFLAARLLSNLAAAALAWQCWAYGRRLAGPAAGAWAMALAAVNPNLWILGQHVSTDMLFAALAAGALLAGLLYLEEPGLGTALAGGALLGLAAFTRSNAVFLLPPLLAAWWLARSGEPRRRRLMHLVAAAGLAVLVLLPHWALRQAVFGDPFHDENWKNLAWKLHGYPDWSYLDRVPFSGGLAVVRDDPAAVVRGGVSEIVRFLFEGGASQLFGTWAHVLWITAGAVVAVQRRASRISALWLLGSCGIFFTAIAFAFFTWGRLLLLLIPPGYGLAFAPWSLELRGRGKQALNATALALVLLLAVKTFGFRLPAFIAHHPYREVAELQRLDADLPRGAALAGSSPFLGRYLRHPYLDLPDAFGPEIAEPRLWFARIEPLIRRAGVSYLVVGSIDLRDRPASLLGLSDGEAAPVSWLRQVGRREGVAIWKVLP